MSLALALFFVLIQPNDPLLQAYGNGKKAQAAGNHTVALQYLTAVAEKDPSYRDIQIAIGQSYLSLGYYDHALRALQRAAGQGKHRAHATFLIGVTHFQKGHYAAAERSFEQAALAAPENPHPLVYQGMANWELGRSKETRRALTAALDLDPDNFNARMTLAKLSLAEGDLEACRRLVPALVADYPAALDVKFLQAQLLLQQNEVARALPLLESVRELVPDKKDLLYTLSQAYFRAGNTDSGKAAFAHFSNQTAREQRIAGLRQALTENGNQADVHAELAALLLNQGRGGEALPHVLFLQKQHPDHPATAALTIHLDRLKAATP